LIVPSRKYSTAFTRGQALGACTMPIPHHEQEGQGKLEVFEELYIPPTVEVPSRPASRFGFAQRGVALAAQASTSIGARAPSCHTLAGTSCQ
jgi:hypothetical protein